LFILLRITLSLSLSFNSLRNEKQLVHGLSLRKCSKSVLRTSINCSHISTRRQGSSLSPFFSSFPSPSFSPSLSPSLPLSLLLSLSLSLLLSLSPPLPQVLAKK